MRQQPVAKPPRHWSPKISPWIVRLARPLRLWKQQKQMRLVDVEIHGLDFLHQLQSTAHGVLLTPNHSHPCDPFAMYRVADGTGRPFYFMSAWQTFGRASWLASRVLRWHGCYSVDREGTDLTSVKESVAILTAGEFPLVIFPEGEIYHTNDRVTPFREGAATIALTAAKRADHPISILPVAIKYFYVDDPREALAKAMDRLELAINWRPKRDLPLDDRIYRYAEAIMAIKEYEVTGTSSSKPLTERIIDLRQTVLSQLEKEYGVSSSQQGIPDRIKTIRQKIVQRCSAEDARDDEALQEKCRHHFDDVFLAVQLFAYPGDYVKQSPTIERIAETIDKFEEDVLYHRDLTERGDRKAIVHIGDPIKVTPPEKKTGAAAELTNKVERRVQALLDGIQPPEREFATFE